MVRKLIFILVLLMTFPCYAEQRKVVESIASEDSSTAVDVPTTLTRYSKSFSLQNVTEPPVGVMYKVTSDGNVSVSIQAQQSYKKPTTELAADVSYVNWETAEAITDESWHVMTLDTVLMPYGRFKLTGSGANDASTEIQIKVIKQ